ncbi:MAG: hypothetical protein ABUK01_06365 [Leptospirales bacterium]
MGEKFTVIINYLKPGYAKSKSLLLTAKNWFFGEKSGEKTRVPNDTKGKLSTKIDKAKKEEMNMEENIRTLYIEAGNEIRHYSNVRSALTTFLITVALGCFATYFEKPGLHEFFKFTGFLLLAAALLACIYFSFRTEKKVIEYKKLLYKITGTPDYLSEAAKTLYITDFNLKDFRKENKSAIWKRVESDKMNWLLLISISLIGGLFLYFQYCPHGY